MNIKSLAVLVALSVGSTAAVAVESWQTDTETGTIKAEVVNPLIVSPPQDVLHMGSLGRVETDSRTAEYLAFQVKATKGYEITMTPSVLATNGCNTTDGQTVGEHGAVYLTGTDLIEQNVATTKAPADEFEHNVYFVYKAPSVAKENASCMVELAATYL